MSDDGRGSEGGVELPAGPRTKAEEARWRVAYERERRVLRILDDQRRSGRSRHAAAEADSAANGLTSRTLVGWCCRYAEHGLAGLLPKPEPTTRAKRLTAEQEKAIEDAIEEVWMTPERGSITAVDRAFQLRVSQPELVDIRTIRNRIAARDPEAVARARHGAKLAREDFAPIMGGFSPASRPLEFTQADHSDLDIEAVHPVSRLPIGRPTVTLILDIFTRAILAFLVSMRPPSSLVTAQALTRAINPKDTWLAQIGIEWMSWPFGGFMRRMHTDRGSDFTAYALAHGCELLNIAHPYRRPGLPDDGGHVERMIGTIQQEMADLPGKTFSDVVKRQGYDSEGRACLTVDEIERIIATSLYRYHNTTHSMTGYTPYELWHAHEPYQAPVRFEPEQVRCAFLPFEARAKVQQYGFRSNYRIFNAPELSNWIGRRHPEDAEFIFASDERDPDWVQFYDPAVKRYFPVPCTRRLLSEEAVANLNRVKRENKGRRTPHDVTVLTETEKRKIIEFAKGATTAAKRARKAEQAKVVPLDMVGAHHRDRASAIPEVKALAGAPRRARAGPPTDSFAENGNVVPFSISNIRPRWSR